MCRHVLVTIVSDCAIAFTPIGSGLRPSSRRMAIERETAGTGRTLRGAAAFGSAVIGEYRTVRIVSACDAMICIIQLMVLIDNFSADRHHLQHTDCESAPVPKLTEYTSLRRRADALVPGQAVGAVRRRSRRAEHRARVHRPARRRRPDRGDPRARRRPRRAALVRRHRRASRRASRTTSPRRASRPATAWRSCWSRRAPFYVGACSARSSAGAIAVPLFTLFGPDGIRLRVAGLHAAAPARQRRRRPRSRDGIPGRDVVVADDAFMAGPRALPRPLRRRPRAADDLAVFQYTSGTTRELPEAVKHTHRVHRHADGRRALRHRPPARRSVLLPVVARVGPRALARHARRRSRSASRSAPSPASSTPSGCCRRCTITEFTNLSAAATHYRMMRNCGRGADATRYAIRKLSFTGEPIDSETARLRRGDVRRARSAACTARPRSA